MLSFLASLTINIGLERAPKTGILLLLAFLSNRNKPNTILFCKVNVGIGQFQFFLTLWILGRKYIKKHILV